MQLCTMLRPVSFTHGEEILATGKLNDRLFFLRTGEVEVLVDGERVRILNQPGEVIGEMSALSQKPTSATVRAISKAEGFALEIIDFSSVHPGQKDRFQFLLYKVYSAVLTERLMQTNEKAKLFERTARDLEKAKRDLETITSGQMSYLLMEAKKAQDRKQVLFVDENKKLQLLAKNVLGGTGVKLDLAESPDAASESLQNNQHDLIFCSSQLASRLPSINQKFVMTSPLMIDLQGLESQPEVSNFISFDIEDRAFSSKVLLTTLTKLATQDLFGLQKYLSWGADIISRPISKSADREPLKQEMIAHFKSRGIRGSLLDRCQVSAEELLMNAIYDAPVDASGQHIYNHLPRTTAVNLSPSQFGTFCYATDGIYLGISVEDPFGALTPKVLIKYLRSCYSGAAGSLNDNKGGAGRGLHQIIESADLTVFNVQSRSRTEAICLWNLENSSQKRITQPTLHFFFS